MNPAAAKPETRAFAIELLTDDLMRMENTPGQLYNMHPGCHVGQGAEAGIALIADALNQVLTPEQSTTLLLETMAGKGTEVGGRFEELAAIIDAVELDEKVGVCLDTCHVWDGGYNIAGDLDGVLEEFDRVIGLDRLRAIHLNDSKNPLGAHKDRHAPIGEGCIGFDALAAVTNHPALRDLPFFLETPQDDLSGWGREIAAPVSYTHLFHIKKENIGLIEIMGRAILPTRLAAELPVIKGECSRAFYEILVATGVFKDDAAGRRGWEAFLATI